MNETPSPPGHEEPRGWPRRPAGPSSPLTFHQLGDLRTLAAGAIVVAVLATLLGALVWGLGMDTPGVDGWKFRVKAIGLGTTSVGRLGLSLGGALFIGVSLLVALALVGDSSRSALAKWARLVEGGAAGAAGWLAFLTLLGLVVDLTEIADAFPEVVGALLIDLGTLLILGVAGLWGLRTFIPRS